MKTFLLWIVRNYKYVFWGIMGVILGICFVKMWKYGDVFSKEYIVSYVNNDVLCSRLWQEILSYRLKRLAILMIFMLTPLKKLYVYWLCLFNGFSIGLCVTKAITYNGGKGILMVLVWLFPHYILYIMTVLLMCHYFLNGIDTTRRTVIVVGMSLLLTLIGTFTESYVNPDIMKSFLNKFCNII